MDDVSQVPSLNGLFREMDVENKSFLTVDEFIAHCRSRDFSQILAEDVFNCLDVDEDGRINNDDFINGLFRFKNLLLSDNHEVTELALVTSPDDQQKTTRNRSSNEKTYKYSSPRMRCLALSARVRFCAQINADIDYLPATRFDMHW